MLDIDEETVAALKKIVSSRLSDANVNRVSGGMHTQWCENFFSRLVVFSGGKRINWSETDAWARFADAVAVMASNPDTWEQEMDRRVGLETSEHARAQREKRGKRQKYHKQRKKTDAVKLQRLRASITVGARCDQKLASGTSTLHQSDKLHPMIDCKVEGEKKKGKRKPQTCGICKVSGHTRRTCPNRITEGSSQSLARAPKLSKKDQADLDGVDFDLL